MGIFALLVGTAVLVFVHSQALFIVTVNKGWFVEIPPLPLIAILYAAALVLLFGGMRLLRAAWWDWPVEHVTRHARAIIPATAGRRAGPVLLVGSECAGPL